MTLSERLILNQLQLPVRKHSVEYPSIPPCPPCMIKTNGGINKPHSAPSLAVQGIIIVLGGHVLEGCWPFLMSYGYQNTLD